jgi:deaminated glutathione amidase
MLLHMFLAACVQITSRGNVAENLTGCSRWVAEAAARGARMAVLPENFAFMGLAEEEKLAIAEDVLGPGLHGPIVQACLDMARKSKVWLFAGGMPERTADPKKVHNTCLVVSPDGDLVATYRKIHLFDVQIPGGAEFQESRSVVPGIEPVVVETPHGRVGLSICYDVRFPELYRELGKMGAQMLIVPAAFTLHTGKDHWHALLRARAIENQSYVLAAAQYGRANDKRVCYGHSLIIDPWGTVVAEAPDREGIALAEIDLPYQEKVRRELPALLHRRL